MNNKSVLYVIEKTLLDDILVQAKLKKENAFHELNESWIEGNVSIDVVEYIIENSRAIEMDYLDTSDNDSIKQP